MPRRDLTKEEGEALRGMMGQLRWVVAQVIISSLRAITDHRAGTVHWARNVDLMLIGMAIHIGQHEGRPMSPNKLAQFLGMPRATVVRKAGILIREGYVERRGRFLYLTSHFLEAPESLPSARHILALFRSSQKLLADLDPAALALLDNLDHRLTTESSKMDTKPVARKPTLNAG